MVQHLWNMANLDGLQQNLRRLGLKCLLDEFIFPQQEISWYMLGPKYPSKVWPENQNQSWLPGQSTTHAVPGHCSDAQVGPLMIISPPTRVHLWPGKLIHNHQPVANHHWFQTILCYVVPVVSPFLPVKYYLQLNWSSNVHPPFRLPPWRRAHTFQGNVEGTDQQHRLGKVANLCRVCGQREWSMAFHKTMWMLTNKNIN